MQRLSPVPIIAGGRKLEELPEFNWVYGTG